MGYHMGICEFEKVLNRLRKSSSDSIDNTEKFDEFKKYMHVTRTAENDLKVILRKVNDTGKKSLVLLCGSAGDGKSHLLSFLKNSDEERLLDGFTIYNDATESSAPLKTAIETLNDLLVDFRDTNLNMPGSNIILAINLGVLSNFIESEYGDSYKALREYVEKNDILTNKVNIQSFDIDSNFQHVSFSDYHMYSLKENGIHAGYIEAIFNKVFCESDDNPFYNAYCVSCSSCPLSKKCPIKANYEFYCDNRHQLYIADLLIKTTIADKLILTTREILNFIYDSIISKDFNYAKFFKLTVNDMAYLKEYIKQITPNLLFDSTDVSFLMNILEKYDPLLNRSEKADENAIAYYVSADVSNDVKKSFSNIPYSTVICNDNMLKRINADRTVKSNIFNTIVRIDNIDSNDNSDEIYNEYIKYLYYFNAGRGNKLGGLYSLVEKAVIQWCGSNEDGFLCLDDKQEDFSIFEEVKFIANISHIKAPKETDELFKFLPSIVVAFEDRTNQNEIIYLDIDYSLFKLLYKLNNGYIQTADDRNNHADFISFVNRVLQTGQLTDSITVMTADGKKAVVSQGMFGYKFKVVR